MNINFENNLLYFHIPKNAGKSIMAGFDLQKNKHINKTVICGLTNVHYAQKYGINLDKFIKFTIIRNPFDRVVSLYHFRKKENDLYNLFPGANVRGGDKTTPDGKKLTFKQWVMDSRSRGLGLVWNEDPYLNMTKEKQIYLFYNHNAGYSSTIEWVNQIHFLTDKNGKLLCDEVLRYENLIQDIEHFCKKYKIKTPNLEKRNSSPRKKNYVDYYDDELIEYVSNIFKDDLDYLDYKFGE